MYGELDAETGDYRWCQNISSLLEGVNVPPGSLEIIEGHVEEFRYLMAGNVQIVHPANVTLDA